MKITICISNYVDTIDVLIDGLKINTKKLSLFSKAEFEHDLERGIHKIVVVKKSKIMERTWKKSVLFDWISCLFGVPGWTLAEKALDKRTCSMNLMVKVEQDVHINFELTKGGFEIIEPVNDVLDVIKQTEICEAAKRRIENAYLFPAIILAITIEAFMLIAGVFFFVNTQYTISIIPFALSAFWAWLVCNMLFKRKK